MKVCNKCNLEKPDQDFRINHGGCKKCNRERDLAKRSLDKEKYIILQRANGKRYRDKDPKRVRDIEKRSRSKIKVREKVRARDRKRAKNPDRRAKMKLYEKLEN